MSGLHAHGLSVGYASRRSRRVVLEGLDLQLAPGRLTALLGANGSGKSTLLRSLVGLQEPLGGQVLLDGRNLAALSTLTRARLLGVVLTDPVDVGLLRVEDLVALGRYPHTGWTGRLSDDDRAACRWAMAATGADTLAGRSVAELSDGERQRVLIARAMAQQPRVLALDEPLAYVDVARRVELVELLRDVAAECGLAVVLTTHDLELAIRSADVLWLVEPRPDGFPGTVHVGAPEDLVLAGTVRRAFATAGADFDHERGTFVPRRAVVAAAHVGAEGAAAVWIARALEREGVRMVAESAPACLRVDHVGAAWQLRASGQVTEHPSVAALLEAIRHLLPTLPAGGGNQVLRELDDPSRA